MIKEISVQELKTMMDNHEDFQLIDVREPYEFEEMNMDGLLIPMGDVLDQLDTFAKDKKVIVHCKSGARSANVVGYLQEKHGMQNLFNLNNTIIIQKKVLSLRFLMFNF